MIRTNWIDIMSSGWIREYCHLSVGRNGCEQSLDMLSVPYNIDRVFFSLETFKQREVIWTFELANWVFLSETVITSKQTHTQVRLLLLFMLTCKTCNIVFNPCDSTLVHTHAIPIDVKTNRNSRILKMQYERFRLLRNDFNWN